MIAVFGWGVGFYGPPIFLHALHETRGWSLSLVSAAVTAHYLCGAVLVANMHRLHGRFGVATMTRAGAIATALGTAGWALAQEPWQLFAATLVSGFGWAATGPAAINAVVSPWFDRGRPAALSMAYNGASVGGMVLSPLWVLLIGALGFLAATAIVGAAMVVTLWLIAARYLRNPAEMGLIPDGEPSSGHSTPSSLETGPPLPSNAFRDWRFMTLAAGMLLGLFAQIGLIAHLFSLLVPALGERWAGAAMGFATACAVAGRLLYGWKLSPQSDRRAAAALNHAVQICGYAALVFAAGESVPLLLIGILLFGFGIGNATSLPPLIAQAEFRPADVARVVALITATSQAGFAFAPAIFGILRDALASASSAGGGDTRVIFIVAALTQLTAIGAYLIGRKR